MKKIIAAVLMGLALVGCGGGDPEDEPIPTNPCSIEYINRFGLDAKWEANCRVHPWPPGG